MLTKEQIVASNSAQLATLHELTGKALSTVEKLAELNLQSLKTALDDHADHAQALLSTTNLNELSNLHQNALQPLAEKAATYSRDLFQIAVGLGFEFSQLAEARLAESQKHLTSVMDATMKHLPNGAESIQNAMESLLSNSASAMGSVNKAVKQSAEVVSASVDAMSENAMNATARRRKAA